MLRKGFIFLYLPFVLMLGACGVVDTIVPVADEAADTGGETASSDEAGADADSATEAADADSASSTDPIDSSDVGSDDVTSVPDVAVSETSTPETASSSGSTAPTTTSSSSETTIEETSAETEPSGTGEVPAIEPTIPSTSATTCPDWDTNPFTATALDIGSGLSSGYEPSGAVWHESRETLFVVSDDGILTEMEADGTILQNWTMGGDLEGVTVVPSKPDFVYLGFEDPDSIAEFNLTTGLVTRTFNLTTWMTGTANLGLEAVTFVEDSTKANGGVFWAGHQGEGKIYIFDLPIVSSSTSTTVTLQTSFTPVSGRTDIADLNYDAEHDAVLVLYDGVNKLRILDANGNYLYEWTVPGTDQEGIALTADCSVVIAEDRSGHPVLSYGR